MAVLALKRRRDKRKTRWRSHEKARSPPARDPRIGSPARCRWSSCFRHRTRPAWFRTIPGSPAPGATDTIIAQRYVAAELDPKYALTGHVSVGAYYLFGHGLEREGVRNTHFVNVNASLTDLALTDHVFFELSPKIYYLRMDDVGGYYATATVSLHVRDFPLYVESLHNRAISTDIVADDFGWNVSLVYAF
jgi:hypothetical protein